MSDLEVDLTEKSVLIGMPVHRPIHHNTVISLLRTIQATTAAGIRCNYMIDAVGLIEWARNGILNEFVHSEFDKLFWIDSDMVWEPEQFFRLLALSHVYDCVGATYHNKREGPAQTYVNMFEDEKPNEHGLMKVKGMGLGFTVVDHDVATKVMRGKPRVRDAIKDETIVWAIRTEVVDGENLVGEDNAFFNDVRKLGFDVWLDGTMRLGHMGDREWRFPEAPQQQADV